MGEMMRKRSSQTDSERTITYGERESEFGGSTFVPKCSKCGRFVKPDALVCFDWRGQPKVPNANCSRCGPATMLWIGYY